MTSNVSFTQMMSKLEMLSAPDAASDEELASFLRENGTDLMEWFRRSAEVTDKARALLSNAFSTPDDPDGIRIQSEDAVKLQWALHEAGSAMGTEDAAGEGKAEDPSFEV